MAWIHCEILVWRPSIINGKNIYECCCEAFCDEPYVSILGFPSLLWPLVHLILISPLLCTGKSDIFSLGSHLEVSLLCIHVVLNKASNLVNYIIQLL